MHKCSPSASIIISSLSRLFIYLSAYLFVYSLFVALILLLFSSSIPRGEQENIHLLMRAVINSEQAHPSFSSSVSLSTSFCPSDRLCLSFAVRQSNSLPLFPSLHQSVFPSLCFPILPIFSQYQVSLSLFL